MRGKQVNADAAGKTPPTPKNGDGLAVQRDRKGRSESEPSSVLRNGNTALQGLITGEKEGEKKECATLPAVQGKSGRGVLGKGASWEEEERGEREEVNVTEGGLAVTDGRGRGERKVGEEVGETLAGDKAQTALSGEAKDAAKETDAQEEKRDGAQRGEEEDLIVLEDEKEEGVVVFLDADEDEIIPLDASLPLVVPPDPDEVVMLDADEGEKGERGEVEGKQEEQMEGEKNEIVDADKEEEGRLEEGKQGVRREGEEGEIVPVGAGHPLVVPPGPGEIATLDAWVGEEEFEGKEEGEEEEEENGMQQQMNAELLVEQGEVSAVCVCVCVFIFRSCASVCVRVFWGRGGGGC